MVTAGYVERDVHVGNLRLHYQEWGQPTSPVILMVHGFGVSGHMFDEFAERMQDQYRLIAIDQRGHGDSEWSEEGDYTREAFVSDLEGMVRELGLDRFVLVGHSMGGLNSVSYTVRNPSKVRALVLVDVGPEAAKEGVDNIVRFTRGPDELDFEEFVELAHRFNQRRSIENIRDRMRHRLRQLDNGKWTWKFDRRFREQDSGLKIGSQLSNDETWNLFRAVRVPTLLIRGAESDVLTQDVAERAIREMPRTRLAVVPGAGHSVPGDNPDDFTQAVREFLGDLESGSFEPVAAAEPPALEDLVEAHETARRGPSLVTLIAIGLGAAAALTGATYLVGRKRASNREKARQQRSLAGRARQAASMAAHPRDAIPTVDMDLARRRALDLSNELALAGRKGISRARAAVQEVEVEKARKAALDVLDALGETTRTAPAAVRQAVSSVDRQKLPVVGKKAQKKGRSLPVLGALMFAPRLLTMGAQKKKTRKQRGLRAWRR